MSAVTGFTSSASVAAVQLSSLRPGLEVVRMTGTRSCLTWANSRAYAVTTGLVLVDASHPDQIARANALMKPELAKRRRDGLMQNEEGADVDEILAEVRATHWRTNIPLYVLAKGSVRPPPADWSAENWEKYRQAQREMQADHARRSPNSKLIIAEKSGHEIPNDQPDLVIDAIKQVVNLARN